MAGFLENICSQNSDCCGKKLSPENHIVCSKTDTYSSLKHQWVAMIHEIVGTYSEFIQSSEDRNHRSKYIHNFYSIPCNNLSRGKIWDLFTKSRAYEKRNYLLRLSSKISIYFWNCLEQRHFLRCMFYPLSWS